VTAPQIEIQLIASAVAVSCALPGCFLILRRMAMMSDAISHSILLGIAVGFFVIRDLASPLLVLSAALTGVVTVSLVELLTRTKRVREDAAIGLIFPALFSIGVILISRYAGDVHLDVDAVLLGELAFAPFNRLTVLGIDIGPKGLYLMSGILLLNLFFILTFYKELKLSTFDAGLAGALGFSPVVIHYGLMTIVSITHDRPSGDCLSDHRPVVLPASGKLPDRCDLCHFGVLDGTCPGRLHRRFHGHDDRRILRCDLPGRAGPRAGFDLCPTRPSAGRVRPDDAARSPVQSRGPSRR
jgi:ABC-type Mn2+/Zn2+ transport system permease subunit